MHVDPSMDGVLIKGDKPIPGASTALQLLQDRQIPWILMTNGGGISEESRAERLTSQLQLPIDVEQIVQSHTPLRSLPGKEEQTVLVIGGVADLSRKVGQGYGFGKVLIPADYVKTNPSIWPFHSKECLEFGQVIDRLEDVKIDNILVFNDPRDLGTDVQVISDVLHKDPSTHVIFSNDDWLWANEYHLPRYGQGVTRFFIESLYKRNHGKELNRTVLGKPTKIAYDYAHSILINRSIQISGTGGPLRVAKLGESITQSPLKSVYMIGDNPASDIIGGFNYGFETGLVRTGVYRDGDVLPCKPTVIGDDVLSVVTQALKNMGLY
ncbi:hypothetical protein WICPIJ_002382 [Wickerhamomyces pijperi]|uniref:Uncharacterized protein n=1 Tax=Wickerhamomyces pijperi TaxID=599730 RepID=A0A9P8Q9T5_WICPI|nr:hypothetical protein WICPIJ_002382 [Wickerhamomyces pijperi]